MGRWIARVRCARILRWRSTRDRAALTRQRISLARRRKSCHHGEARATSQALSKTNSSKRLDQWYELQLVKTLRGDFFQALIPRLDHAHRGPNSQDAGSR